jgi:non-specific serine/threonine protein kinase
MGLLHECLALFQELGDDWGTANSLANLAHVMLTLDDRAGALGAFRQSLEMRRALGNILHIAESLEGLAALAAAGQPRVAAQLLGAAEALRETSGAPVPAAEQDRYADLVAQLRRRLRDDTFAAAWTQGRALSMESAIDLALRDAVPNDPGVSTMHTDAPDTLSPREREIAQLIARGASNPDIAGTLMMSVKTVETHVRHVFSKLDVRTRAEVAVWAVRHGLV